MKNKKILILTITYIIVLFFQTVLLVPYKTTQTFISNQNVPHTIITDRGFDYIGDIGYTAENKFNGKLRLIVETIDMPILMLGLFLSAGMLIIIACFIIRNRNTKISKATEIKPQHPTLDVNSLAFADSETQNREFKNYEKAMKEYLIYELKNELKLK